MLRHPVVIILFFIAAAALLWTYVNERPPQGIEVKGPQDWTPWVSLAGSIVSFFAGLVTLGLKIAEVRSKKS